MYALMAVVFVLGYLCIAFEHPLKIDKAAAAILTAVLSWTVLILGADSILPLLQPGSHDPIDSSTVVVPSGSRSTVTVWSVAPDRSQRTTW